MHAVIISTHEHILRGCERTGQAVIPQQKNNCKIYKCLQRLTDIYKRKSKEKPHTTNDEVNADATNVPQLLPRLQITYNI